MKDQNILRQFLGDYTYYNSIKLTGWVFATSTTFKMQENLISTEVVNAYVGKS